MPKKAANIHNSLNINALPPPIAEGKENDFTYSVHPARQHRRLVATSMSANEAETIDIKVSPVVSRLIWSLLDAVFANDDEDDALGYKDKMLLEDILRFGTIAEVAKQRGAKSNILTYEFNQALSRLRTKIDTIEKYMSQLKQQRDGNQIIPTQSNKIEQLREENFDLKAKIAVLEHQLSQLKEIDTK